MIKSFGEKIKLLRESAELTQTQLGNAVHMTQRKISYIERGTYEPSISDIIAFCCFFDISSDYLLGLPADMNYPKR
ncbi:MAG: helix-turn-helix transcriptional regulator [Clostridia bacterium]|nr:helix-turn-helix transcriptional regulator [Clostridia bacterium]